MVSPFNTNNIHSQPQPTELMESKTCGRNLEVYYSDTYAFTKFHFFNPIIKEFSNNIISNFGNCINQKYTINRLIFHEI